MVTEPFTSMASTAKVSFDDVYDQPDASPYAEMVLEHHYELPGYVADAARHLWRDGDGAVVDVGCGYGFVAATARHAIRPQAWALHLAAGTRSVGDDVATLGERVAGPAWVGVDRARQALDWATQRGMYEQVIVDADLSDPSNETVAAISAAGLVVAAGAFGYIGPAVAQLCVTRRVRYVFTLLAWDDPAPFLPSAGGWDVSTVWVPQRRPADSSEAGAARAAVRERGDAHAGAILNAGWLPAQLITVTPS